MKFFHREEKYVNEAKQVICISTRLSSWYLGFFLTYENDTFVPNTDINKMMKQCQEVTDTMKKNKAT